MTPQTKSLVISAVLITLGLIVLGGASTYKASRVSSVVTSTATPTPSPGQKASTQADYTGLDSLVDSGLSDTQLQDVKYAFNKYITSSGKKYTTVTLDSNSVKHNLMSGSSPASYTFNGKFDGQDSYQAKVAFNGLTDARLYLYDTTGAQIFDSGTVDLYNNPQP